MAPFPPRPGETLDGRRAPVRSAVLAVVAMLVAIAAGSVAPSPAAADSGVEARMVELANRARGGGRALAPDLELAGVARRWSAQLAAAGRLAHNPRLRGAVGQDWYRLGENVGTGDSADQIHDALMASATHRANIVDRGFTHVGVGVTRGADGRLWIAQVFMQLREPTRTAPAAVEAVGAPSPAPVAAPRAEASDPHPAERGAPESAAPAQPRYALVLEALARLDRGS